MIYKFKNCLFLILILAIFSWPLSTVAIPFGGKITSVKWCKCSGNFLIKYRRVRSFMPENLSYRPGVSILYEYGQILKSGAEILGITSSPDLCVTGHKCHDVTFAQLIQMVGTSH